MRQFVLERNGNHIIADKATLHDTVIAFVDTEHLPSFSTITIHVQDNKLVSAEVTRKIR